MAKQTVKTQVLIRPVVTEKATELAAGKYPVYAFFVAPGATKPEVRKAVRAKYQVEPIKIAMITSRRKVITNRLKPGLTARGKKALVYLAPGTTLNLV
jgi:large subunit ribosomal protein L23